MTAVQNGAHPAVRGTGAQSEGGSRVRLRRIELHGFKTFAARSILEFAPGITAVVGPNGSGKCVSGDTLVTLADGRDVPIRDLVDATLEKTQAIEHFEDGLL